jgi:dipeptidyl aminopeptidase/acylaminoacyl peptidase
VRLRLGILILALMILPAPHGLAGASARPGPVSFRDTVAPLLAKNCLGCHGDRKASGGLNLATFASLKRGGKVAGDTVLEAGDPDASYLIESIGPDGSPRMPYKLPPLSGAEIATLTRWVKEGAKYDGPSPETTPLITYVDVLSGLPKVALKAPAADPVASAAFSPDGRIVAAAVGRQVLIYDLATSKAVATLGEHPGPVTSVRFTRDGKSLVAAGGRAGQFGSVTIWDVARRQRGFERKEHADTILAAEFAPDGKTLATAGYDKLILIWDLTTGKVKNTFRDHSDSVYGLAFSPDGKTLASCAADRTVKLWDMATGKRTATLSESTAELYSLIFTPDGSHVLAAGVDRSIRMWRIDHSEARLEHSTFAHDAPIVRLAVSADGTVLASSAEDRTVRLWTIESLAPREAIPSQADWVQALAFSRDAKRLALGRYDGSLALWDLTSRKMGTVLRESPAAKMAAGRLLVRNASLNPPSPRGAVRGRRVNVTLTGQGVGRATAIVMPEPGLTATIVPAARRDDNRVEVELTIAPEARVGIHSISVITPQGVPGFQSFAVDEATEVAEKEPNETPDPIKLKPTVLPATFLGAIDRPGDVDLFAFEATAGDELVLNVTARAIGSLLRPSLALLDQRGHIVVEANEAGAAVDPALTYTARASGPLYLRVADADYGGSGAHFYRIAAGRLASVQSVFPLGVQTGQTAAVEVAGSNLSAVKHVSIPMASTALAGTIVAVPVAGQPVKNRTVLVADGPQMTERETNDELSHAQEFVCPGGVSGHIGHDGDVDLYRFRGKKGERIVVELYGRRLGSPIDSIVSILDKAGLPIPRAVLRPVDQTEMAFRDHPATAPAIRLTRWNNLAINDYILFGRELGRIRALPRNLDDDCVFWNQQGQRLAMLETTPEQHPMAQPMYKVEIHPPGTVFPPGGVPAQTLTYSNDDGGPAFMKDSRVTFDVPADGDYLVRVEDVRGQGGEAFGYHLVLRRPKPSFRVTLSTENPNIPRGGTTLVSLNVARIDGFDLPIEVRADCLPPGITSMPVVIGSDELSGLLALTAEPTAPAFSPPTWRVIARADAGPSWTTATSPPTQEIDPGGPAGGWITVTSQPNLQITARPARIEIRPGQQVTMTLAVDRSPAFRGRVPIDVKNLPQGVRVLNIGLNGVLITEVQTERIVSLIAEPWAGPMVRAFYAVGKAESAGTEESSAPIELVVLPSGPQAVSKPPNPRQ